MLMTIENLRKAKIQKISHKNNNNVENRDVRGGAFSSGAGRGEDKNPRGGAKVKIRGAGQKNA